MVNEKEKRVQVSATGAGYSTKGNKVYIIPYGWKNKIDYRELWLDGLFAGLKEKKDAIKYAKDMKKIGYKVSTKKVK